MHNIGRNGTYVVCPSRLSYEIDGFKAREYDL